MPFIHNVENSGENIMKIHRKHYTELCCLLTYVRIMDLTNTQKMEHIKIQQSTSSMLLVPLPTTLPCFQPTITRRTSGRCLGTFTKANVCISPSPITNAVHLIAPRSQSIICCYSSYGEQNFAKSPPLVSFGFLVD